MLQERALIQEESAKKSFQQMMRRKMVMDESRRKAEERRLAIMEEQGRGGVLINWAQAKAELERVCYAVKLLAGPSLGF